jgi:hypothetical protein
MATWRNDRIYALSLLAGCGAILLLYVAACVVIDPYSVFGLFDFSRMNVERSFRYAKTRYIAEHCGEYRGILFGNSRSLQFSERDMEDDFEERYFNFSVQADSFAGIEEKLAWLMPRCGFKDVVLVVDAQMMLSRPLDQGLFLREHYYVTRTSKWEFYAPFLLVPPKIVLKTALEQLAAAVQPAPAPRTPELVGDTEVRRGIPPIQRACYAPDPVDPKAFRANMDGFHRIIRKLRADGRSVQVLVAPLNQNLLARFDYHAVADAVADVVQTAGGATVFTGYNKLSLSDDLYMDLGHYNGATAALLLQITASHERSGPLMGWYSRNEADELRDLLIANGQARAAACATGEPMISTAAPPRRVGAGPLQ